ncbi:biogenesis of lysosome-related organelles complex 1 subunit 5 [Corythoichthys intestinalis]|uniref:biogenesis of lysosome-related organelles complex 1 subunit 5 n=1 Tax=Corythoichthys intestinalis TaxID=161448 RepID=UPI0025A56B8F|nr:biogenesis of lysosome-related organelles complex 1 subunit 5 [Corythoichthys intestinalis]
MKMDKIIKDVGDIQSRLLDHRPIINAEIRYFVREFEEKRAHRDSRLLENLSKVVQEANDQVLPSDLDGVKQQLSDVIARLKAANHMAERVQQRELETQQSDKLQENMERIKVDWADFLKEQQRLKEEVAEEHAKDVGLLSTRYNEKKKDLDKLLSDV